MEKSDDHSNDSSDGEFGFDDFGDDEPTCRAHSIFGIIPAVSLADCSGNKTVDFDDEVLKIGMESQVSDKEGSEDDKEEEKLGQNQSQLLCANSASTMTSESISTLTTTESSDVHSSQVYFITFYCFLGTEICVQRVTQFCIS